MYAKVGERAGMREAVLSANACVCACVCVRACVCACVPCTWPDNYMRPITAHAKVSIILPNRSTIYILAPELMPEEVLLPVLTAVICSLS